MYYLGVLKANKFKTTAIEHDQRGEISAGLCFIREWAGIGFKARGTLAFAKIATPDKVGFCPFATSCLRPILR